MTHKNEHKKREKRKRSSEKQNQVNNQNNLAIFLSSFCLQAGFDAYSA